MAATTRFESASFPSTASLMQIANGCCRQSMAAQHTCFGKLVSKVKIPLGSDNGRPAELFGQMFQNPRVKFYIQDLHITGKWPGHALIPNHYSEPLIDIIVNLQSAIVAFARSNLEWFVAKSIGRLGGPSLGVSFIEIRDMSTERAAPDAQGAVTRPGVPKGEEWKKMAADCKSSSITLGNFVPPEKFATCFGHWSISSFHQT